MSILLLPVPFPIVRPLVAARVAGVKINWRCAAVLGVLVEGRLPTLSSESETILRGVWSGRPRRVGGLNGGTADC